jgi:hypothetical protein
VIMPASDKELRIQELAAAAMEEHLAQKRRRPMWRPGPNAPANRVETQLAEKEAEVERLQETNKRLRMTAHTPLLVLDNGASVSMEVQGADSIVVRADYGCSLMALPHEEDYIEIQVKPN